MASCPRCGADINWVEVPDHRGKIALENYTSMVGADRYRTMPEGGYEPVDPKASVAAYPIHDCEALVS